METKTCYKCVRVVRTPEGRKYVSATSLWHGIPELEVKYKVGEWANKPPELHKDYGLFVCTEKDAFRSLWTLKRVLENGDCMFNYTVETFAVFECEVEYEELLRPKLFYMEPDYAHDPNFYLNDPYKTLVVERVKLTRQLTKAELEVYL